MVHYEALARSHASRKTNVLYVQDGGLGSGIHSASSIDPEAPLS